MKRLVLFSHVLETTLQAVLPLLFPDEMQQKVFACMPSDGHLRGRRYELFVESWRTLISPYGAEFVYIDNSLKDAAAEQEKLRSANILLITGGNVCTLLRNLRRSGLDQAICEFAQKEQYVIAGYSAGAMVLTPTVQLANFAFRENAGVGLTNFDALHLVDYEIFPHYTEKQHKILETYRTKTSYPVRPLKDDEYILVDC